MIWVNQLWRKKSKVKEKLLSPLEEFLLRKTNIMRTQRKIKFERPIKNKLISNLSRISRNKILKPIKAIKTESLKTLKMRRLTSFRRNGTSLQSNTSFWRTSLKLLITNCYKIYNFSNLN